MRDNGDVVAADVARGTASGCDAALRPRGEPGWPAQEALSGAPLGREATRPRGRPCGAPRVGLVMRGY